MATSHSTDVTDTATAPTSGQGSAEGKSGGADREKLLRRYVQHHWVGARAGLELFRRVAGSIPGQDRRDQLAELTDEVSDDREALRGVLNRLGASAVPIGQAVAAAGVVVGRLKTNGALTHRTDLTDLLELEALSAAVEAKKRGWLTLHRIAATDNRVDRDQIATLIRRADAQIDRLTRLHDQAANKLT